MDKCRYPMIQSFWFSSEDINPKSLNGMGRGGRGNNTEARIRRNGRRNTIKLTKD